MCSAGASVKNASADYSAILEIEKIEEELIPRYYINAYSFPKLYTLKQGQPKKLSIAHWGLIPSFVKDWGNAASYKTQTINAKAETVFEKVSYKKAILENRCIILLDGFFEYQQDIKEKNPFYIYPSDKSFFMLGGICENWTNKETGETISTFSIITTTANALMSEIHNSKKRMPLIFDKKNATQWLEKDLQKEDIISLMQEYPDEKMKAHRINKKLLSSKNLDIHNPATILPYTDTKGKQQSLF